MRVVVVWIVDDHGRTRLHHQHSAGVGLLQHIGDQDLIGRA